MQAQLDPTPSALARACSASLARSRDRRHAVAQRLVALRRRRQRRSGTITMTTVLTILTLGAPLALGQDSAQAPAPTDRGGLLTPGSNGTDVAALQRALGVQATGTFGPITQRAVRRFQRRHGLTVDGVVGPQTRAALGLASASAASQPPGAGAATTTLKRIAQCESGGDPTAVSSDGNYRGKYQFTRATWQAMGGSGDPAAAPETEQDRLAAALLAQRGTAPWPACGRG